MSRMSAAQHRLLDAGVKGLVKWDGPPTFPIQATGAQLKTADSLIAMRLIADCERDKRPDGTYAVSVMPTLLGLRRWAREGGAT